MRSDDFDRMAMEMALGARLQMRYGIGQANELLAIRRGHDPVMPLVSVPELLRALVRLAAAEGEQAFGALEMAFQDVAEALERSEVMLDWDEGLDVNEAALVAAEALYLGVLHEA